MDPAKLEAAITPRTKAILPVHLYGQMAEMDPIMAIAERHGIAVIEDACQAHGAEYKGRRAGSIGVSGCFSFYPGKNLGACGEGGAVVTNNDEHAKTMRMLRDWGQEQRYHHVLKGFNYRMDGIQGAILRVKLRHLEEWTEARRDHGRQYTRCCWRLAARRGARRAAPTAAMSTTSMRCGPTTATISRRRSRPTASRPGCTIRSRCICRRRMPISATASAISRSPSVRRSEVLSLPIYPGDDADARSKRSSPRCEQTAYVSLSSSWRAVSSPAVHGTQQDVAEPGLRARPRRGCARSATAPRAGGALLAASPWATASSTR